MSPKTPYSDDLNGRDPVQAMRETSSDIARLLSGWTPAQFERRSAPGKWTARQILLHLAQCEWAFGARLRTALTVPDVLAPSMEQDAWLALDAQVSGKDALQVFIALAKLNVALYGSLSVAQRQVTFTHPAYGKLTVDWIVHQQAGHLIHHWTQLEALSAPA